MHKSAGLVVDGVLDADDECVVEVLKGFYALEGVGWGQIKTCNYKICTVCAV